MCCFGAHEAKSAANSKIVINFFMIPIFFQLLILFALESPALSSSSNSLCFQMLVYLYACQMQNIFLLLFRRSSHVNLWFFYQGLHKIQEIHQRSILFFSSGLS